jgi:hypothetical protein
MGQYLTAERAENAEFFNLSALCALCGEEFLPANLFVLL